jgi:ribosome biogenesis GTPase
MQKGLILRSTGSWYDVSDEQGEMYKGRLRGKLKLNDTKQTNPIAVGDYVDFEVESEADKTVMISRVHERENKVVRQSTRQRYNDHVLAANVDQALVLATLSMPRTSLGFIDRFLVAATSSQVPAVIVFNKCDLLTPEGVAFQAELRELYESIGYATLEISALTDPKLAQVWNLIRGKKTLVAGHSGVGKSTLVNALAPDISQKTAAVSKFANKGVHTTTFAEMFEIEPGTFLIDTPGIKELGIVGLEENQVGFYFPEIKMRAGDCKYYNCSHQHEPGCKVIEAVEAGEIAGSRYHSYLSILAGNDNRK